MQTHLHPVAYRNNPYFMMEPGVPIQDSKLQPMKKGKEINKPLPLSILFNHLLENQPRDKGIVSRLAKQVDHDSLVYLLHQLPDLGIGELAICSKILVRTR